MIEGRRKLEAVAFFVGLVIFAAVMILMVIHHQDREHEELMNRSDYLIARSEASLKRWNNRR